MRDRHVLITGGSSGIGLAFARLLAAEGARLSLVARDPLKLSAAHASLRSAFPSAPAPFTAPADVADEAAVVSAVRAAEAVHGPVDLLVASAGVARPGRFAELPAEVFRRAMDVNYFGALHAVRAVVPAMIARRSGRVVLISSGAGLVGLFGYTAYAPSKFALRGFAESLRAELKPAGVGVTIVYPPDTDTPQLAEENLTKPAETRALTAAGGLWSADAVARATLAGIRRGAFCVTPGLPLTLLSWFHSPLAPLLRWSFDRTAARAR